MTDERNEQRKFEKAMRSHGIENYRLKRPIHPSIYSDPTTNLAWKVWQLARKEKS